MIDILAIAPHPDDAELGVGGLLAKCAAGGQCVALADTSLGEMASFGSVEERLQEARSAAHLLGVTYRFNLGFADGSIGHPSVYSQQVQAIVWLVRLLRPRSIFCPALPDRHPDHLGTVDLMRDALFKSGLPRYQTEKKPPQGFREVFAAASAREAFAQQIKNYCDEPWRPKHIYQYSVNRQLIGEMIAINGETGIPVFVDISEHYEVKQKAITAYQSQFAADLTAKQRLSIPDLPAQIKNRDTYVGSLIGVPYAEPLIYASQLAISDISEFEKVLLRNKL